MVSSGIFLPLWPLSRGNCTAVVLRLERHLVVKSHIACKHHLVFLGVFFKLVCVSTLSVCLMSCLVSCSYILASNYVAFLRCCSLFNFIHCCFACFLLLLAYMSACLSLVFFISFFLLRLPWLWLLLRLCIDKDIARYL